MTISLSTDARPQPLAPGGQLAFAAARGTEVFCATGSVELTALQPWMGDRPFTQLLRAGQAWRAAEGTRVTLVAGVASSVRIVHASTEHRPRGHDVGRDAQQDVQGEGDAQR